MAHIQHKYPDNQDGKYFVDEECIACETCVHIAPSNFVMAKTYQYAYVVQQPQTPEDEIKCIEALEHCPVDAIGQDPNES